MAGIGHRGFMGRKQAGAWQPSDIPNLRLWVDSLDSSTITESDGGVLFWGDKSGTQVMRQDTSSQRPQYIDTERINFDGSNDSLARNRGAIGASADNITSSTWFAIFRTTNTSTTQVVYSVLYTNVGAYIPILYISSGNVVSALRTSSGTGITITHPISADTYYIASVKWGGNNTYLYINGVLVGSNTGANMIPVLFSADAIGRRSDGTPNYLSGDVLSTLWYLDDLSDTDRESVEDYLNNRFSIY